MLGGAVGANDGDAERGRPLAEGDGHGRTAETDPAHQRGMVRGEVGVIQEAGQEHRCAGAATDARLPHHLERVGRIPAVDQVDGLSRGQRAEHGAEHPGRMGDGRAHKLGFPGVM